MEQTDLLTTLTSSSTRTDLLRLFFGDSPPQLHLREIERRTGISAGTLHRELEKLSGAGLLISKNDGNRVVYSVNERLEAVSAIRDLVRNSHGLTAELARHLPADKIDVAFVYGSLPRGDAREDSDADVLIIGNVTLQEVARAIRPVIDTFGRDINPVVMDPVEFSKRISAADHFVTTVSNDKKWFIIGDEEALGRLGP